ncbi:hypothetical protein AGMMS49579_05710 [Spirochaetia bacterium]|nr:hypothetical protein AGMMS49579_05710 [Spirochaetia bacterium]
MTGVFLVPSIIDVTFTIYPSNKYILIFGRYHANTHFGHIQKQGEKYFAIPIRTTYGQDWFEKPTEIICDEEGIFIIVDNHNSVYARRKRPTQITPEASAINIPARNSKTEYYSVQFSADQEKEISYESVAGEIDEEPGHYFRLAISHGNVQIVGALTAVYGCSWLGYLDIQEKTETALIGRIIFTSGASFYYIDNGIVDIIIKDDEIIVTIPCASAEVEGVKTVFPDVQPPVYLVLKF